MLLVFVGVVKLIDVWVFLVVVLVLVGVVGVMVVMCIV